MLQEVEAHRSHSVSSPIRPCCARREGVASQFELRHYREGRPRPDQMTGARAPQMLDGPLEVGRVDLQAQVQTAREPGMRHHSRVCRAKVLRPDAGEVQPVAALCRASAMPSGRATRWFVWGEGGAGALVIVGLWLWTF